MEFFYILTAIFHSNISAFWSFLSLCIIAYKNKVIPAVSVSKRQTAQQTKKSAGLIALFHQYNSYRLLIICVDVSISFSAVPAT